MDEKERWLLRRLTASIQSGNFTELDVLALLMLLRRHAAKKSPVHEFADFVAHRDKKQGIVQQYLRRVQLGFRGETSLKSVRLPVFDVADIRTSFNKLFSSFGVPSIDLERANQITVCVITLLQSVQVRTGTPVRVRGFEIHISSSHVELFGHAELKPRPHVVGFPLLRARNNGYYEMRGIKDLMHFNAIAFSVARNGVFRIEQT